VSDARHRALPIVGVMGSGSSCDQTRCRELGRWLATERHGRPVVAFLPDRAAIPELPESVPDVSTLDDLRAFVRKALGRTP
jgi:hypothetical protein